MCTAYGADVNPICRYKFSIQRSVFGNQFRPNTSGYPTNPKNRIAAALHSIELDPDPTLEDFGGSFKKLLQSWLTIAYNVFNL
jgi:hypothetical protein